MDACEPRVRRRGFFLHSETTGERETGEPENPEGFVVRVRMSRMRPPRRMASSGGRSRSGAAPGGKDRRPQIRSGSATGSRQPAHSPR
jgi:hypothetical protein